MRDLPHNLREIPAHIMPVPHHRGTAPSLAFRRGALGEQGLMSGAFVTRITTKPQGQPYM